MMKGAGDSHSRAAGLLLVRAATLACTAPDPDPAAVRLAALAGAAAADSISDLQAVDNPDAAGVRDTFHNATREALAAARQARDTAPATAATAFAESMEAAEAAERLGDALALALEARDDYAAARDHSSQEAATLASAIASAAIGRDLRALEAAEAALTEAKQRHDDAFAAWSDALRVPIHRRLGDSPAAKREERTRVDLDRAGAAWSAAIDVRHGLIRRLRANAAGSARGRPTLPEVKRRFGAEQPTLREVERLEAAVPGLTDAAVEAAMAETEAADRAQRAMAAAEARVDDAVAAYRAAVDAWRTLLE